MFNAYKVQQILVFGVKVQPFPITFLRGQILGGTQSLENGPSSPMLALLLFLFVSCWALLTTCAPAHDDLARSAGRVGTVGWSGAGRMGGGRRGVTAVVGCAGAGKG